MRLIDAEELKAVYTKSYWEVAKKYGPASSEAGIMAGVIKLLENMPTIKPEPRWIPFKFRPATEDEKEMHPDFEFVLDCELPESDQRILTTVKRNDYRTVHIDEFFDDAGCYLDSGYEIGSEVVAWAPMPEPYKGES